MSFIADVFYVTGKASARRPWTSIFIGIMIAMVGCLGFFNAQSTANPQELWVPPASRANVEQEYFAKEFGFFFRIDTAWITPLYPTGVAVEDNMFKHPYMDYVAVLDKYIDLEKVEVGGKDFTLDDLCYKPITGADCLIESPMQYFKGNQTYLEECDDEKIQAIGTCIP